MNLNKRWRYSEGSVDVVYASHLFEHLNLRSASLFLKESYRCLKKGGVIRLVIPDLHKICLKYLEEYNDSSVNDPTVYILWAMNLHKEAQYANENIMSRLMNELRGYPHQHKFMYDDKSLAFRLKNAGFSDIRTCVYGESHYIPEIRDVEGTKESYLSAYVEAIKP
jgi:ubiquinone/menaquinone biosynthesis C-methylase UbiE